MPGTNLPKGVPSEDGDDEGKGEGSRQSSEHNADRTWAGQGALDPRLGELGRLSHLG
jgi:hypothetical protein